MMKRCIPLLLPLALGTAACATDDPGEELAVEVQDLDIPNIPGKLYTLGQGVDSATQKFYSTCVRNADGKIERESGSGHIVYDRQMTSSELESMFGVDAGVKARYGAVNGSARASFTRSSKSRRTSINVVFGASYDLKVEKFPDVNAELIPGRNLAIGCGDSYVSQIAYGADLAILYRIDFASESDKMAFESSVTANYAGLAEGDVNIKAAAAAFKGRASVHVEIRQFGGDVSYMAEALAGSDGGMAATECAIDNLNACNKLVAGGIKYAATTFAKSAKEKPGVRNYVVEDYSLLQLKNDAPQVPDNVANARDKLADLYDAELEVQDRVMALRGGFVQLAASHRTKLDSYSDKSDKNMKILKSIVPVCFDDIDLKKPATLSACTSAVSKTRLKERGYVALDAAQLDFPHVSRTIKDKDGKVIRDDFWNNVTVGQGDWGTWRGFEYCPANTFAIGYALRVEERQGKGDDTALNAVILSCAKMDHSGSIKKIDSYPGLWGATHPTRFCRDGVLRGGKMKIEDNASDNDDTAANDFRAMCSDGLELQAAGGGDWGDWADGAENKSTPGEVEPELCDPGTAVCGINSRFEKSQGDGDDTAMNGLSFACCAF